MWIACGLPAPERGELISNLSGAKLFKEEFIGQKSGKQAKLSLPFFDI